MLRLFQKRKIKRLFFKQKKSHQKMIFWWDFFLVFLSKAAIFGNLYAYLSKFLFLEK